MGGRRVVFVLGGSVGVVPHLGVTADDTVIAVDGGLQVATALGLPVDVLVGDLDSVDPVARAAYEAAGGMVTVHPTDKDETDFELALRAHVTPATTEVIVLAATGGRLDHLLGNLAALGSPTYRHARRTMLTGPGSLTLLDGESLDVDGEPGELISLMPVGGGVEGVTTTGLRWPLLEEQLPYWQVRGLSNEFVERRASVTCRAGVLAIVRPA